MRRGALIRQEAGIGLVELMIVILILGVVGGITVTGLVQGMQTSNRIDARVETSTELQRAAERVARDLRRGVWTDIAVLPLPPEPTGCTYVSLDPDTLTLIVFDGPDRYRHVYTHAGDALSLDIDQWVGGGWADVSATEVVDDLRNAATGTPLFTYLDRDGGELDGTQASDHADVRNFRLTLVGAVREQPPMTLTTTVAARNGGLPCPVAS